MGAARLGLERCPAPKLEEEEDEASSCNDEDDDEDGAT